MMVLLVFDCLTLCAVRPSTGTEIIVVDALIGKSLKYLGMFRNTRILYATLHKGMSAACPIKVLENVSQKWNCNANRYVTMWKCLAKTCTCEEIQRKVLVDSFWPRHFLENHWIESKGRRRFQSAEKVISGTSQIVIWQGRNVSHKIEIYYESFATFVLTSPSVLLFPCLW